MVMDGKKVMIIRIAIIAIKKGMRGLTTSCIFMLATLQPMNNTEPTGGVQSPMFRFSIMMMPKCMGSMPNCVVTMGKNMGVKINTAGVMSIKIPTKSRMKLIINRMMKGLDERERSPLLTVCGMFSNDITHDSPMEVAISSITMLVVFTVLMRMSGRSLIRTSLYRKAKMRQETTATADASVAVNIPAMIPPMTTTSMRRLGMAEINFLSPSLKPIASPTGYFLR